MRATGTVLLWFGFGLFCAICLVLIIACITAARGDDSFTLALVWIAGRYSKGVAIAVLSAVGLVFVGMVLQRIGRVRT